MNIMHAAIATTITLPNPDPSILGQGAGTMERIFSAAWWAVILLVAGYTLVNAAGWAKASHNPGEAAQKRSHFVVSVIVLAFVASFGYWFGIITAIFA
jgi:hypothetical protein